MSASPKAHGDKPKRAPTLYCIVAFDIVKGALLLLTALGIFVLGRHNLTDEFDQFVRWVHLDPERKFFVDIAKLLDKITPANLRLAEVGTFFSGLVRLGVGLGLAFRARWAVWLAIGESAFFIPIILFELLRRHVGAPVPDPPPAELFRHPELGLLIVLVVNIIIVWYLLVNRQRLFRHHH
jgi:uncharacterized membrane protein (DUF2068 family)